MCGLLVTLMLLAALLKVNSREFMSFYYTVLFFTIICPALMASELLKVVAPMIRWIKGKNVKYFQIAIVAFHFICNGAIPFLGTQFSSNDGSALANWLKFGTVLFNVLGHIYIIVQQIYVAYLIRTLVKTVEKPDSALISNYAKSMSLIWITVIIETSSALFYGLAIGLRGAPGTNGDLFYVLMFQLSVISGCFISVLVPYSFTKLIMLPIPDEENSSMIQEESQSKTLGSF
jgi:hypothetical protein